MGSLAVLVLKIFVTFSKFSTIQHCDTYAFEMLPNRILEKEKKKFIEYLYLYKMRIARNDVKHTRIFHILRIIIIIQ